MKKYTYPPEAEFWPKTKRCCFVECGFNATTYQGFVIHSRDKTKAGFCDTHASVECPNIFGKNGCFGLYDKSLGEMHRK